MATIRYPLKIRSTFVGWNDFDYRSAKPHREKAHGRSYFVSGTIYDFNLPPVVPPASSKLVCVFYHRVRYFITTSSMDVTTSESVSPFVGISLQTHRSNDDFISSRGSGLILAILQ